MRGVDVLPVYLESPDYDYVDLMSYCGPPVLISDYQRSILLHQSEDYLAGFETTPPGAEDW